MKKAMDVIEVLKHDHEVVKNLLAELTETSNRATKKRAELFDKITKELKIHTQLEEEIVYPAFREAGGTHEINTMYHEAVEEHRAVEKLVIPDLQKTDTGSDQFGGRAKVLKEMIEHHVEEEEEEMFKKMKEVFDSEARQALGRKVQERRAQLQ